MTKDELESAIKVANFWSSRSTLILAIGILGEYALLPFFEKKRWQRVIKIFFAVLVVAGILGEYEFSSSIAQYADKLQGLSDKELTDSTIKAGAAIERASKADERSKQLETSNLKLRNDLLASNTRLTTEQARLQEAQQAASRAQKDAADAQRRLNDSIVARMLDRHIDVRLGELLKTLPPAKAEIQVLGSDREAVVFAIELRNTLTERGWTVSQLIAPLPPTPGLTGVTIVNRHQKMYFPFGAPKNIESVSEILKEGNKDADKRLVVLATALGAGGLDSDESLKDGEFRILIGTNVLPNGFPIPGR